MDYEEMTLTEYREQVLAEFRAIDVTAYNWFDYKKESPCVVLFNDSPLIEKPEEATFEPGVWRVSMYLVLKAEHADGDVAVAQLDELTAQTLEIVEGLDDVSVGATGQVENERDTYVQLVTFSKTFKVKKG